MRERLNLVYAKHTGQPVKEIAKALDRDNFMTADNAKEFGIIDEVITERDNVEDEDNGKDKDKEGES